VHIRTAHVPAIQAQVKYTRRDSEESKYSACHGMATKALPGRDNSIT
jgi:hypothetical protein